MFVAELSTVIVMDYQNVHLTGQNVFAPERPIHECLIHPLHYANRLIHTRNLHQREGYPHARLSRVLVYRGLPSPQFDPGPYAWNLAHQAEWERDRRITVHHRPLKYKFMRDADGRRASDATGNAIVTGKAEKGIDVLCALAIVREAQEQDVDLVILASQDTDLEPALVEGTSLGSAKIETASWYQHTSPRQSKEIRCSTGQRMWNTRLSEQDFQASLDRTAYR